MAVGSATTAKQTGQHADGPPTVGLKPLWQMPPPRSQLPPRQWHYPKHWRCHRYPVVSLAVLHSEFGWATQCLFLASSSESRQCLLHRSMQTSSAHQAFGLASPLEFAATSLVTSPTIRQQHLAPWGKSELTGPQSLPHC